MFAGEFHLMIADVQLEDDAVFECQVGATVATTGLMSHKAQLTVQGEYRCLRLKACHCGTGACILHMFSFTNCMCVCVCVCARDCGSTTTRVCRICTLDKNIRSMNYHL